MYLFFKYSLLMIVNVFSSNILFFRYQRIHKLIFEEDGLPNGAEVAYYARGQVAHV